MKAMECDIMPYLIWAERFLRKGFRSDVSKGPSPLSDGILLWRQDGSVVKIRQNCIVTVINEDVGWFHVTVNDILQVEMT